MFLSDTGRILVDFLLLDLDVTEITYQDCLEFLTFMDYYVSKLIGSRELKKFCVLYPGKTLLDKMTASDIAFAILCYENGVDVWLERIKMKRMNNVDREAFEKTASLKYHHPPGTKLKAYEDGWTEEGVKYYDEMVRVVKGIMANEPLWENVKVHWKTYLRENRRSSFVHAAAAMGEGEDGDDGIEEQGTAGDERINNHDIDLPGDDDDE